MYQDHIVVVGAGIVGLSTAFALLQQGIANVTIVEQSTVGHERGASHGISRLLRFEYGADRFYSEMVQLSLQRWRKLEQVTQRSLYTPTGVLVLDNSTNDFAKSSYETLYNLGYPSGTLSRRECQRRFPQFSLQGYDFFTYNERGGILHASSCLQMLKDVIQELGGKLLENQQIVQISRDSTLKPIRLRLQDGQELTADRLVLTVGSWVHRLLGDLHLPVRLTRQYVLFFDNLPASIYGLSSFPAFLAGNDFYGFPICHRIACPGSEWLKVASHTFGIDVDPDEAVQIDPQVIDRVVHDFYQLLPDLQRAKLVRVDACMYDVSPDESFILDRLPDDPRIVFATGLSGHGFKFGPLLGEIISSLLGVCPPPVAIEHFRLQRFHR